LNRWTDARTSFSALRAADPGSAFDRLARLEVFVDLEEVLYFQPVELRQVPDVTQVFLPHVGDWDAQHLVVRALLVGHLEHAYRPAAHQASGERRLF
jgi:hypothetical protein